MNFLKSISLGVWLMLTPLWATQATLEYTTVELLSEVESIKPSQPFWLVFKIMMKPGWHTYWKNPGDSGLETQLTWELPEGFSVSPIQWLPPERLSQSTLVSFGYTNEAYHLVQIIPPKDLLEDKYTLSVQANWLVCKEACIPEETKLALILNRSQENDSLYSQHKPLIDELVSELPEKPDQFGEYQVTGDNVIFYLPAGFLTGRKISEIVFFPEEKGVIQNSTTQHWSVKDNHVVMTIAKNHTFPDRITGLIQATDAETKTIKSYQLYFGKVEVAPIKQGLENTLWGVLLLAFLGGFVLNAMPCVFPVLSLKAVTIAKKVHRQPSFVRQQGLLYMVGVIVTFLVLATVLIGIKQSGETVGWGFQMQNPYFIVFMTYLMFFIGLSLSGVVYLPILFGTTQSAIKDETSKWGSFWIGILAVLVATPCTAPFMGVAIGYAMGQPSFIIVLIFLSMAIGFALPYLLISLFPAVLKGLPKPGRWMETFKEFMAFPMYACVAWLLWVLVQQTGSRGLIICLMGLVLMAFSIWIWQRQRQRPSIMKVIIMLVLATLTVAPIAYLQQPPEIVRVEKFSRQRLQELRAQGRPVFVYGTAAWCITCKVNEVALKSTVVQLLFKDNDIAFLEADWTNQDAEITDYLGSFGRSGVPLYVFYPKTGESQILPQILTEAIIVETIMNGG
jgi:thiol:disulfide interchange protein DsbD